MRGCCSSLLRKLTSVAMGPCVAGTTSILIRTPRPYWKAPMQPSLFDLSGKAAIVTGGNGGIGLGMVRGLAEAGADIAIVGRNEAKSNAAVADLKQSGVRAIAVV